MMVAKCGRGLPCWAADVAGAARRTTSQSLPRSVRSWCGYHAARPGRECDVVVEVSPRTALQCRVGKRSSSWGLRRLGGALNARERWSWVRANAAAEFSTGAGEDAVVQGRVVSHRANFVHVRLQLDEVGVPQGEEGGARGEADCEGGFGSKDELLCVTRQVLKKMKRQVLVGDFVEVSSIDWTLGHGVVKSVLPRQSTFQTPAVANVEIAIVMFSLRDPPIEANQVNRFLVAAEGANLPEGVLVVLNKQDLVPESETREWVDRLKAWGYEAIPISTHDGTGVDRVWEALEGQLGVIVGPSGVGKSSLINAINTSGSFSCDDSGGVGVEPVDEEEEEVELLDVGEVSARTGRGKHTTRNISLIKLSNGGFLADTPGFNQPHLLGVTTRELASCFPEIVQRLEEEGNKCEFKNCVHVHEPGCAVRGDWERYPMYVDLYHQVKDMEERALKMGSKKESREGDFIKKIRKGGKVDAEPRLNRKKHRRTSRKLSKQQWRKQEWDY
ncbi:putative ribosome biogenesis GTPase RsgA [Chloropicon primus]|uniref:Putative ribosome biogenesis GTPase RsgA n=1 Tax=Chloropicon primus TaxID=1764295 RepID=A0A5B8MGX3_9CHLO|nr:putative ribosome biogenesis GTPase RsgA [Chloropicon primus]UPQ99149.1 putative ribosome biogenesis GTPase RsgA [Chloropicon primus]|eukprot:QDZ19938.1 putative ribosome biogenesis GTPase RsgA [Chloropicon primus]